MSSRKSNTEGSSFKQEWEQRSDETDRAFYWFTQYLQQTRPRSLKRLASGLDVSYGYIRLLSSDNDWRHRARIYDNFELTSVRMSRRDHVETFADQVTDDASDDYNAMRKTWTDLHEIVIGKIGEWNQEKVDPTLLVPLDDMIDAIQKLARARETIDRIGRRSAELPMSHKAPEKKPDRSKETYMLHPEKGAILIDDGLSSNAGTVPETAPLPTGNIRTPSEV